MFSENLIRLRKEKGLSQQELADLLHLTRQTVSKWERQLSLPDADQLSTLAKIFNVSVSELLDEYKLKQEDQIVEQLMQINSLLVDKRRRSKMILKIIVGIIVTVIVINILLVLFSMISSQQYSSETSVTIEQVE